jgi:AraC-like DNA-binding protein
VIKIEYNQSDFEEVLRHLGRQLKVKIRNQTLVFPEDVATGTMRFVELYNGLQVMISDYIVHADLLIQRKKSNREFLSLRFDELMADAKDEKGKTSVVLTNTKFDWMFLCTTGMHVYSVNIRLDKRWLDNFFSTSDEGEAINKYLALKISSFHYDVMDTEYGQWFRDIIDSKNEESVSSIITNNRIMLLLERFFTRIYEKMNASQFTMRVSSDDIVRIKQVESLLLEDFSMPAPSLDHLARIAAMSSSKLKAVFKEIYGMPIFQYYQKQRMQKAKAMLLSKKYSVNQVGSEVGYSNLVNFNKAFEKTFQQLPNELIS